MSSPQRPTLTRIEQLAEVPLFRSLGEQELQTVATACHLRRFKRGEVLFHEGDPGNCLFVLQCGHVKIVMIAPDGKETILRVQGPGESLGELSLIDGAPRSATGVAQEAVQALTLHRDDFLALVEQRPAVARAVMAALADMVRRLSAQFQAVATLDVRALLAQKLLELADRHGQAMETGIRIALRLTQQELADMIGATRVSVNQHVGSFQDQGILTWDAEGIILHRPDQLWQRIY
jgi:CRP/FNR family cyclic AMP-dependent transcriptional regulator